MQKFNIFLWTKTIFFNMRCQIFLTLAITVATASWSFIRRKFIQHRKFPSIFEYFSTTKPASFPFYVHSLLRFRIVICWIFRLIMHSRYAFFLVFIIFSNAPSTIARLNLNILLWTYISKNYKSIQSWYFESLGLDLRYILIDYLYL